MSKANWVTRAAMLACAGALGACGDGAGTPSDAGAGTTPPTPTVTTPPPPTGTPSAPAGASAVLSGQREVTIVRVQASESGLSLDNGELVEVDDDSGRQLFVPTPLGGDRYLIKAYGEANGHPANDEASCWQVDDPGSSESLSVEGAVCDAENPAQRFTIRASGKGAYSISNDSAFLQYSARGGLILEELGDAPLRSTFRFVDNGPARRPAGG
ncbi:RICIN domain-containing protein [Plantactinospora solaniradicis]|uniref:RICIN domain-containing protein n=1 Tax=Plantactinospora solaniradicis TaxID=1723736 RepID=A0ABW1KB34_9ACTN